MGFGSRLTRGADEDLANRFRKELEDAKRDGSDTPEEEGRPSSSTHNSAPVSTSSSSRPTSFNSNNTSNQAGVTGRGRPTSFGQNRPVSPPSTGTRPTSFGQNRQAPAQAPAQERPAVSQSSRNQSSSFRSAPTEHGESPKARVTVADGMRLDRLIEEVAAYRNASPEDIERLRKSAENNPEATLARLQNIYEKEVKAFKEKNVTDITAARVLNPGDVVFSISIGTKQKVQVIPREQAEANGLFLLDGSHVIGQPAESTPFGRPADLFGVGAGIRPSNPPVVTEEGATRVQSPIRGPRP